MNQFIKVPGQEGGNYSAINNRVTVKIPQYGSYDLSTSYVNLRCSIQSSETDGIYLPYLYMKDDSGSADSNWYPNVAIVRDVKITSSKKGVIALNNRLDIIQSNLVRYRLNWDGYNRENYKNLFQSYDRHQQVGSVFRQLMKEGSTISREVTPDIQIPLKDLDEFCHLDNFSTDIYGSLALEMNISFDRIGVGQILGPASADNGQTAGINWSQGDNRNAFANVGVGGDALNLVTTAVYTNLADSNFWVGQQLTFNATYTPGNLTNEERKVVAISWSRTTGKITLTLSSALADVSANGLSSIVCYGKASNFTFSCSKAEMVLEKLTNPPAPEPQTKYTTWLTEEDNLNGIVNLNKQYMIEPECVNLFVMKNEDIYSLKDDMTSYRMRIDGVDISKNKDIVVGSPIYWDMIRKTMLNAGFNLQNLDDKTKLLGNRGLDAGVQPKQLCTTGQDTVMVCSPMPPTNGQKRVQLEMKSTANGFDKITLFKQIVRVV